MTGFWVFVYGLMTWLPAYSIPEERKARVPQWYHYPLAVVAPILLLVPLFILVTILITMVTRF
jgi:hypothetical protein